jgi:myo-inositol-1(or 4)-monophosphatase
MTDLPAALAVAEAAADEAATISLGGLGRARKVDRKQSSSDLVTEFDIACERAILARLKSAFPGDALYAEEGTGNVGGASRIWYVDPIDGTTNFSHGLPFYCTSIALFDERGPAVGVIDAPALGWRFSAMRGNGAFLRSGEVKSAIEVSHTETLGDALLATGFPYNLRTSAEDNLVEFAHLQRAAQAVRRAGAAALDLAMVAAGWFDGYWEQTLKPWDCAAGLLLVMEAGGRVTDYDGNPISRDLRLDGGRVVATNGRIHDELIRAVRTARAR